MSFLAAKDLVLGGFGAFLTALYIFREPFFVYPVMALTFLITWESAGWNGFPSALTVGAVVAAFIVGALFRLSRGQAMLVSQPIDSSTSIKLVLGGFVFWLLAGLCIYILMS